MKTGPIAFSMLFFLPAAAPAQTWAGFPELASLTASDIAGLRLDAPHTTSEKSWGVTYALEGVLSVAEGGVVLNTPDGRLFQLDLSLKKAGRLNGRTVKLEARARQADDLSILKVESVREYTPKQGDVVPPPYQPRRRQARLLSDKGGELVMDNVRTLRGWNPLPDSFDWTTAAIRPELIKNVYFVKKPFTPEILAAHSLLLFTFEPGGLRDAAGNEPAGLTLSIEARTRVGQDFSPVSGLWNTFGIIWHLATWEDYSARTIYLEKGHLVPYPVLFTQEQKARLLREAMTLAAVDREGEFFNTVTNNCTNNLLIIMNRVLPENERIKLWAIPYMVYNAQATMPLMVISSLQKHGILGAEAMDINASTLHAKLP